MATASRFLITGLARSGTTLVAKILDAHPRLNVASDPFLPLFKGIRNAILDSAHYSHEAAAPFQDFSFDPAGQLCLRALLTASPDVAVGPVFRAEVSRGLKAKMLHESPDLIDQLGQLEGVSLREIVDSAFRIIAKARGDGLAGFKDVWIVDFVPLLVRAFEEFRAVIVVRDPRAILASMEGVGRDDPDQQGHWLSYLRHFRKQVALLIHFEEIAWICRNVRIVHYEDLVVRPEPVLRDLCAFLEVEFHDRMLLGEQWRDRSGTRAWNGNSSHIATLRGISSGPVDCWRDTLDPATVRITDTICREEMAFLGMALGTNALPPSVLSDCLRERLEADAGKTFSWRSVSRAPDVESRDEVARRMALERETGDEAELARLFFFPEAYHRLRRLAELPRASA